jgi:hypothetical protein
MAGILDPKNRILDVIITPNGRRQLRNNTFEIRYASFTDRTVFYGKDDQNTIDDVSEHIQLEAFSGVHEVVIPEIDEFGMFTFDTAIHNQVNFVQDGEEKKVLIFNGKLYNKLPTGKYGIATGSVDVYSGSRGLATTCGTNFKNLKILKTKDEFFGNIPMSLTREKISFKRHFTLGSQITNENIINPAIIDSRLKNVINMRYLPPVNTQGDTLGTYAKYIDDELSDSFDALKQELDGEAQKQSTFIQKSTHTLNVLGQVFENTNGDSTKKLTIVDAGEFFDENGISKARVYFAGKFIRDVNDVPKFIRIFSLVFKRESEL